MDCFCPFFCLTGLFEAHWTKNRQKQSIIKRLLCELELSDDNVLYLVGSVLMRPLTLSKIVFSFVALPLCGVPKISPQKPNKGCAIIAQCARVGESHF